MRTSTASLLLLFASLPLPAQADEDLTHLVKELRDQLSELKAQVRESNARIGELEQKLQQERKQAETAPPVGETGTPPETNAKPVTAGDVKGSIKLPGSDTSIAFGGFAKLDILFNNVSAGTDKLGDQQLYVPDIPVGTARAGEHGQVTLHAKESRLWFRSFTPGSQWGDINTLVELDLFGARDSYTARLRHAYGSIGNLLAGQTTTTFGNSAAIPEQLDAGTPVGDIVIRQPQVRWTQPIANTPLDAMVALEMPRSRIANSSSATPLASGDERYPDMVMRLNGNYDWGTVSLAALGRQIRISDATGVDQSAWGGAVSLAGRVNTTGLDNLRFMLNYGNALARYVTADTYADAALDAAGHMELITMQSGMLSYQHYWSELLRSTVTLSYSHADLPAFVNSALTREARSAHINLLWSPVPQATFGLEYLYALRELRDGQEGELNRLQFSTRFNF